jgi:hypothetical protein
MASDVDAHDANTCSRLTVVAVVGASTAPVGASFSLSSPSPPPLPSRRRRRSDLLDTAPSATRARICAPVARLIIIPRAVVVVVVVVVVIVNVYEARETPRCAAALRDARRVTHRDGGRRASAAAHHALVFG